MAGSSKGNQEWRQADLAYKRDTLIVMARPFVKKAFFIAWVAVDVLLVLLFVGYFGFYIAAGIPAEQRHVAKIGQNIARQHEVTAARAADSLITGNAQVFPTGDGEYNLYATVENPNSRWYAEFTYVFASSNQDPSETRQGFALPGETRPLVAFRQPYDTRPINVRLQIENVTWHRIDPHRFENIDDWLEERNQFEIADARHGRPQGATSSDAVQTTFTLQNRSSYGYWDPSFILEIRRGGSVAGVNLVTASGLTAGEERGVRVRWFGEAPPAGTVSVYPQVNYFDEDVYMPPPGEQGPDIRDTFESSS